MQYKCDFDGYVCNIYDLPKAVISSLQELLYIDIEEEFYKKILSKVKKISPIVRLYNGNTYLMTVSSNNFVTIFTGLLPLVLDLFKKNNISLEFIVKYASYTFNEQQELTPFLYEHQKRIIDACIKNKRGIIQAATGSGKGLCIAELTRVFTDANILITVPSIALLYQLQKEVLKLYEIRKEGLPLIGLIGDGNLELDKKITIAIPDTLASRLDSNDKTVIDFLAKQNVLCGDELHLYANTTYIQVIEAAYNRRVSLGFSATPYTRTGANLILEGIFGKRIIEVKETEMINKGIIMKPLFKFYKTPSVFIPSRLQGEYTHWKYHQLYDLAVVQNKGRNELIAKLAVEFIKSNQGPLAIIVNKVATSSKNKNAVSHAELLSDLIKKEGYDLPIVHGVTKSKVQEQIFNQLRNKEIEGVIGGPTIISTGVNIPSLSCIILAGGGRSQITQIQRIGRVLRLDENKAQPIVIDFYDNQSFFHGQSNSRIDTACNVYGEDCVTILD